MSISLQTESRISKLLLLKGYADLAPQLRQYSSRVVSIPTLFRTTKIPTSPVTFSSIVNHSGPPRPKPKVPEIIDLPSPTTPSDASSTEIIEWQPTSKPGKKDLEEWTEAKKGKTYNPGKAGKPVTTVRDLKPRPCHTYIPLAACLQYDDEIDRYYLSPWGCKSGDDCEYGHQYSAYRSNRGIRLMRLSQNSIQARWRSLRNSPSRSSVRTSELIGVSAPYQQAVIADEPFIGHFTEAECVYG